VTVVGLRADIFLKNALRVLEGRFFLESKGTTAGN
jgi:hypothetical protein